MSEAPVTTSTPERVISRVKWFNNKSGYGFATTCDDSARDVFIHHSAITVAKEQYRYLIQGEYVELDIMELSEGEHKYQAGNVTGIKGGFLMCETKNSLREESEKADGGDSSQQTAGGRGGGRGAGAGGRGAGRGGGRSYRSRGGGPRDGEEWMLVRRY